MTNVVLSKPPERRMSQLRKSFQGSRRKAGTLLLAVAVGLTGCWFRSYLIGDRLRIWRSNLLLTVESNCGQVHWQQLSPVPAGLQRFSTHWEKAEVRHYYRNSPRQHLKDNWEYVGFNYDAGPFWGYGIEQRMEILAVPYWSLVLPLAILSGWLILAKRPTMESKQVSQ